MHDFHPIDVSHGQFVQRYHIFRIVVFDFKEIRYLPIRFLRQPAAYLNVDTFIALHRHKINFLRFVLPNIDLVAPTPQFKMNILVREYRCSGGTDTANPAPGNRCSRTEIPHLIVCYLRVYSLKAGSNPYTSRIDL